MDTELDFSGNLLREGTRQQRLEAQISPTVPNSDPTLTGEYPSFICSELRPPRLNSCIGKLTMMCNAGASPPGPGRLLTLFLLDNDFYTVYYRSDVVIEVLPPQNMAYNQYMLHFADALLKYGSFGGFRQFISQGADQGALDLVPFFCRGLTLDEQQCEKLLMDCKVIPRLMKKAQFQISFARAFFLYRYFITVGKGTTSYGISKTMRLCYLGCCLLFYAVSEAIVKRSNHRQERSMYGEFMHASGLIREEYSNARGWNIAHLFGRLLDDSVGFLEPFGMLQHKPLMTPDLNSFSECAEVFRRYDQDLRQLFNQLTENTGKLPVYGLCHLILRSRMQELLPRPFVLELALRNARCQDRSSSVPALSFYQFYICIFACANYALCREPFVKRLRRPDSRLDFFIRKLMWVK